MFSCRIAVGKGSRSRQEKEYRIKDIGESKKPATHLVVKVIMRWLVEQTLSTEEDFFHCESHVPDQSNALISMSSFGSSHGFSSHVWRRFIETINSN
jgi:hypothetical protein